MEQYLHSDNGNTALDGEAYPHSVNELLTVNNTFLWHSFGSKEDKYQDDDVQRDRETGGKNVLAGI
jgi:hypothetical protein